MHETDFRWLSLSALSHDVQFISAIFGQSLNETMQYEVKTSQRKVPVLIEMCVDFLLKNGVETEGIFRYDAFLSFFLFYYS